MKEWHRLAKLALALVLIAILIAACSGAQITEPSGTEPAIPATVTVPSPTAQVSIQPTPTSEPASTPSSSVDEIVVSLDGLPLEDFFEESYKQLLLRDPEHLTELRIAGSYGLRNDQLNNLSDAYLRQTQDLEVAILDLLRSYDRSELTPEQQVSYDVYEWYLDDQVRGHQFIYYDYPVHHMIGSYQDELIRLFTEYHPLSSKQDAEDYISRLSQVDVQVGQLLEGLRLREEAGVIPPKFIIELARGQMTHYLGMRSGNPASIDGESLSVYTVFSEGMVGIGGLSDEEREALGGAALAEIEESFIPAYMELIDYLEYLATVATDDAGVWKFPDGDAYYAHILRSQTTTNLTAAEIHELGLAEVARIQAEMRAVLDQLGYPQDESLGESMDRVVDDGGLYDTSTQAGKNQLLEAYEALIDEVDQGLDEVFDIRPRADVVVIGDPTFGGGGYYVPPAVDGSRPGAFHTGTGSTWTPKYNMATVAYHEAIPGHHFQIAIAQHLDLPTFRKDMGFNGYVEGWALYAERLAWELGLYEDDPYGNLGRLQLELLRAVRLVTDTGIHSMKWTREEAKAYMDEALGAQPGTYSHEVDRYVVMPAQATSYKVGMMEILELRQTAMDELGDGFDLKEFHNVVLANGSMPLDILERVVQDYIDAKKAGSG